MPKIIPIPPKEDLENLYVEQRLTTREISNLYGVSRKPVERWLRNYGIPLRLPGIGLIAQGKEKPTPEQLRKLVYEDGLTYQEIGNQFGVTKEAVLYWMKTYKIPATGLDYAQRQGITLPTPEEFLDLYEDQKLSLKEIAELYQTTRDVITTFCKSNNLSLRNSGFDGGKRYECEDGHIVRSIYEQRVDNWLSQHGIDHSYEPPLPFDKRYKADFLANGWYIEIWGMRTSITVTERPHQRMQKEYIRRHLYKLKQYKENKLPLVEIHEHHFDTRRPELWAKRLACVLNPPKTTE